MYCRVLLVLSCLVLVVLSCPRCVALRETSTMLLYVHRDHKDYYGRVGETRKTLCFYTSVPTANTNEVPVIKEVDRARGT